MCSTNYALKYFGIQLQTDAADSRKFVLKKDKDFFEVQDDVFGSAQFQLEQMLQEELGSYPTPPSVILTLPKVKKLYEESGSQEPVGKWYKAQLVEHQNEPIPPSEDNPNVSDLMDMSDEELEAVRFVQWPTKAQAQKFVQTTFPSGALNEAGDVFVVKPSVYSQLQKAKAWVLERLTTAVPGTEEQEPETAPKQPAPKEQKQSWAEQMEEEDAQVEKFDPVAEMNKWFHYDMNTIPTAQRDGIYWPIPPSSYTGKEKRNMFASIPNGKTLQEVIDAMLPLWPCGEPPFERDLKVRAIVGQLIRFKAQLNYSCQTTMITKKTI